MGAGFSLNIKCPQPFVSTDALSCVMPCPADKKFVRQGTAGSFKCVYSPDPSQSVDLVTVGAVPFNGTTLQQLQSVNPQKFTEFSAEQTRFENAIVTLYANIDKQKKINDAFRDLQLAENARDQSPKAYQAARTAYYLLVKGPGWIEEERARVATAVVEPQVQRYRTAVSDADARTRDQQKTLDVVNGIKDKVLSLRDDFKYSVGTLSNQVEKVRAQVNLENRTRDKEKDNTWVWVDTILNVVLVVALVYAAYTVGKRYLFPRVSPPSTVIRIPAYTGQSF